MIFHENRLPADDSHEISCLICYFWKSGINWNCHLLQIIGGALWVKDLKSGTIHKFVYHTPYLCTMQHRSNASQNEVSMNFLHGVIKRYLEGFMYFLINTHYYFSNLIWWVVSRWVAAPGTSDHTRRSRVWSGHSWRSHETWSNPSDQVTKVIMFLLYTYIKTTTTNTSISVINATKI